MGASNWAYFVPYQVDINKALQDLREDVFNSGNYYLIFAQPQRNSIR